MSEFEVSLVSVDGATLKGHQVEGDLNKQVKDNSREGTGLPDNRILINEHIRDGRKISKLLFGESLLSRSMPKLRDEGLMRNSLLCDEKLPCGPSMPPPRVHQRGIGQ